MNMSTDLKILSNRLQDLSISLEKVYCIKILSSTGLSRDLQEQSLKFNLAFSNLNTIKKKLKKVKSKRNTLFLYTF